MLEPVPFGGPVDLSDAAAAPPPHLDAKAERAGRLDSLTDRLNQLQKALFAEGRRALLVVLQGRDAAGKDGVIRKVFGPLDAQGCGVTTFRKPSELELAHDYLWRVHAAVPRRGFIGVFNRSHYEDVLVVRVLGLVPQAQWEQRYEQINAFEKHLAENDTVILKFFLHVSRDEQKHRLQERLDDPAKNWKFNPGDLDTRRRWDEYTAAYADALTRCSTPWAPWYLVPADQNGARDVMVAEVVVDALERMNPQFPKADPEVLRQVRLE
jgi:PPK2 family polyphosphate:nucleotide phosphotransferase